jgi:hypothetical protein
MERKSDEELFEELNKDDQHLYLRRADYLIQYGYIQNESRESLAVRIYSKRRVKQS